MSRKTHDTLDPGSTPREILDNTIEIQRLPNPEKPISLFNILPTELQFLIFTMLDNPRDLKNLALVNSACATIMGNLSFWMATIKKHATDCAPWMVSVLLYIQQNEDYTEVQKNSLLKRFYLTTPLSPDSILREAVNEVLSRSPNPNLLNNPEPHLLRASFLLAALSLLSRQAFPQKIIIDNKEVDFLTIAARLAKYLLNPESMKILSRGPKITHLPTSIYFLAKKKAPLGAPRAEKYLLERFFNLPPVRTLNPEIREEGEGQGTTRKENGSTSDHVSTP